MKRAAAGFQPTAALDRPLYYQEPTVQPASARNVVPRESL
jgi:hypothetical protein